MLVKEVTFILENCDQITIPGKYIGNILVDGIKKSIGRWACNWVSMDESCEDFFVEIHPDANKTYYQFGQECDSFKAHIFERLQMNDITHVEIVLYEQYAENKEEEKEEKYYYSVNWTGESDEQNESQKTYVSEQRWLYIVISEKSEDKFYNKEEVNDADEMRFYEEFCELGDEHFEERRENG